MYSLYYLSSWPSFSRQMALRRKRDLYEPLADTKLFPKWIFFCPRDPFGEEEKKMREIVVNNFIGSIYTITHQPIISTCY